MINWNILGANLTYIMFLVYIQFNGFLATLCIELELGIKIDVEFKKKMSSRYVDSVIDLSKFNLWVLSACEDHLASEGGARESRARLKILTQFQ